MAGYRKQNNEHAINGESRYAEWPDDHQGRASGYALDVPQAVELEEKVLGALMLEPGYMSEVAGVLAPENFFDPFNGRVYEMICAMYDADEPIDLSTIAVRCRMTDRMGTQAAARLAGYTSTVGTGSDVAHHASVIREKHVARRLITTARKVITQAVTEDVAHVIDGINAELDSLALAAAGGRGSRHISSVVTDSLELAAQRRGMAAEGRTPGITTGIGRLDAITAGWKPSELVVLAARPSMGKTALMLHFAKAAAASGHPACIYSLEMSGTSLADRLVLSESTLDPKDYRAGTIDDDGWKDVERAAGVVRKLPIYIDDNPVVSMRYIRSHAKTLRKRGRCDIIFIDYLQLADTSQPGRERNREQEIAQASRQAKILAKELEIPVVLLSQLSRRCEERVDKTPRLSDLRESGAIEQDADVVGFMFRPAYYGIERWPTSGGEVDTKGLGIISIAKQRNGATGDVAFAHNHAMTRFADYKRD